MIDADWSLPIHPDCEETAMASDKASRVIVGVDEGLAGLHALRCAVTEARRRRGTLLAVRVWSIGLAWPPGGPAWQEEMSQEAMMAAGRAFTAAMVEPPRDVVVRVATVQGAPGPELVRLADRDDDLLVVGSGQRKLFGRMSHGSTARYCAGHAGCPVLVVPPHALARAGTTRALSQQLLREARRLVDRA
jgi:nucleotide-binding universal stress UspA family protein